MNARSMNSFVCVAAAAIALMCLSSHAQALEMTVQVVGIGQVPNFTSRVKVGHIVNARTNMISIAVGGSLRVSCPSPYTGTIEAANARTQTDLPPNALSVEIPSGWIPTERELPGFNNVPGRTSLTCAYLWSGNAKEAMYSLGTGGMGLPIGGETQSQTDTVVFEMYKPGTGTSDENNGCIR